MTAVLHRVRSGAARYRRLAHAVRRRPESARALVVVAVVHVAALAGAVWWVVALYDVIGDGVTLGAQVVLVGLAAVLAATWVALAVGVWRGSEDARRTLWQLAWLWVWTSALLALLAFFVPLVLTAVAGYTVWYAQQEDVRGWTAVSPAPGPGSPPR